MIALTKERTVNRISVGSEQPRPQSRGSFSSGETGLELVQCYLQINRTRLPIDIPAALLAESGEIVLNVPSQEARPVQKSGGMTAAQKQEAKAWVADMEDFDRF